ncbi:MAG TPA: hypothetical protein VK509_24090 [Polyangiales bacterium]|nr:hypothetical protein [Polyangiales bacterium]
MELRVSTNDGKSVVFTIAVGDNIESLDPLAARALEARIAMGDCTAVATRPARIDHDIDSKPRIPRAATEERTP